jgi:hypothetical protein
MFFGDQMFAFFTPAVDHRNTVGLRPGTHSATEASRHAHEVSIVQFTIRTVVQPSSPGTKTTWRIRKPEVENDTIGTVLHSVGRCCVTKGSCRGSLALRMREQGYPVSAVR